MSIIKWRPFVDIFDEMDKTFSDVGLPSRGFMPALNVYQNANEVIVESPMPGIDPEKVNITIENDVLTVEYHGEKKKEVEEKQYALYEWSSQDYHRSVALPASVKSDAAEASYKNGVLKIVVPKKEEVKAKKVEVKVK